MNPLLTRRRGRTHPRSPERAYPPAEMHWDVDPPRPSIESQPPRRSPRGSGAVRNNRGRGPPERARQRGAARPVIEHTRAPGGRFQMCANSRQNPRGRPRRPPGTPRGGPAGCAHLGVSTGCRARPRYREPARIPGQSRRSLCAAPGTPGSLPDPGLARGGPEPRLPSGLLRLPVPTPPHGVHAPSIAHRRMRHTGPAPSSRSGPDRDRQTLGNGPKAGLRSESRLPFEHQTDSPRAARTDSQRHEAGEPCRRVHANPCPRRSRGARMIPVLNRCCFEPSSGWAAGVRVVWPCRTRRCARVKVCLMSRRRVGPGRIPCQRH